MCWLPSSQRKSAFIFWAKEEYFCTFTCGGDMRMSFKWVFELTNNKLCSKDTRRIIQIVGVTPLVEIQAFSMCEEACSMPFDSSYAAGICQTEYHSEISLNQNPKRLFSQIERRDADEAEVTAIGQEQWILPKGMLRRNSWNRNSLLSFETRKPYLRWSLMMLNAYSRKEVKRSEKWSEEVRRWRSDPPFLRETSARTANMYCTSFQDRG